MVVVAFSRTGAWRDRLIGYERHDLPSDGVEWRGRFLRAPIQCDPVDLDRAASAL
jgi:hypothetical protein